jgi:hypothetical protein
MRNFTTEYIDNVLTVRFKDISSGWEQWVLWSADRHHDSAYCNRKWEKKHLEQAKERDALIADFGDIFCAMQGKWDPRASKDELREEDKVDNYLDTIIAHAAEDYGPYAANWLLIGQGNHDMNIKKRHGTNIVDRLVHDLRKVYGSNVVCGGYSGWMRFMFTMNKTRRQSIYIKYHHGAGGGGPVTKGMISTARQSSYLSNADIVINGHTHDSWITSLGREVMGGKGKVKRSKMDFIRTPGYKDEYFKSKGIKGFEIETWKPPKPIGAVWHRFWMDGKTIEHEATLAVR